MNRLTCFGFVIVTSVLFSNSSFAQSSRKAIPAEKQPNMNALVCGPKCVRQVLKYYGWQADLSELIREIQWPDYEKGSTMAALAKALERRGIHVKAVVVPRSVPLRWSCPIILHFADEQVGHFAVLMPTESENGVVLWSNERVQENFPADVCFKKRTEIILLTSNREITHNSLSSLSSDQSLRELLLVTLPILPFFALSVPLLRKGARTKS